MTLSTRRDLNNVPLMQPLQGLTAADKEDHSREEKMKPSVRKAKNQDKENLDSGEK
jgi:hypothetical protein